LCHRLALRSVEIGTVSLFEGADHDGRKQFYCTNANGRHRRRPLCGSSAIREY
jgi:hypothetical protein